MKEHADVVIEQIKVQIEVLKHQYDYFKNVITINTGAFILIVAFMDRAFKEPKCQYFVFFSLACFSVSLLISLLVMKNYTALMNFMWDWNFGNITEKDRSNINL